MLMTFEIMNSLISDDMSVDEARAAQVEAYEEMRETILESDSLSEHEKEMRLNELDIEFSKVQEQWVLQDRDLANGEDFDREFIDD